MNGSGDSGCVELIGGRLLRLEAIGGLINRVRYLPNQHFERAQPQERAYAESELSAFVLGWVNGVAGRVINPPLPFDLGGGTFPTATLMAPAVGGCGRRSRPPARGRPPGAYIDRVVGRRAVACLPQAPITGKASGDRPVRAVLKGNHRRPQS
jgi:hypothetical protein